VNNWFSGNGFTVGISDTICDKKTFDEIADILFERKKEVDKLIMQMQRGDLELRPGSGLFESFERQVNASLNEARDASGKKLIDAVDTRNNILHMVNAGSKGKQDNLSQILACVGQQNIEGKRIQCGFVQRTLPHFSKYDYGALSRGFVNSCYLKGLSP
jgi:DNA-directed RNA polymerase II subunit RPB1